MSKEKEIYEVKKDPRYRAPYIDVDEIRERSMPDGTKTPFRYVHGGFEGTDAKFVFCFPIKEQFKGRFYQYLSPFPGPDEEMASLERSGEMIRSPSVCQMEPILWRRIWSPPEPLGDNHTLTGSGCLQQLRQSIPEMWPWSIMAAADLTVMFLAGAAGDTRRLPVLKIPMHGMGPVPL